MLCSEILTVNRNPHEGRVSLLRCKKWDCEICHPYNRQRVIRFARHGKPNAFITLTVKPDRYETPDEAARDMKRAFVLLRRAIWKKYRIKNMPFLVVFERTKAGWPHMHILARVKWISQAWLSQKWNELLGAPIVDIRRIQDQGRMVAYITKYIGKELHSFANCKRWWRSHNYDLGEDDQWNPKFFRDHWEMPNTTMEQYRAKLEAEGFIIEDDRGNSFTFRYPWMPP